MQYDSVFKYYSAMSRHKKNAALGEDYGDGPATGYMHFLMTAEARCEIRNTSRRSDLQFLKAFGSLACLASNCEAHAHTKSAIIHVELAHFSLCRVSLWRWNNGTKDGSIIVCPNHCRGQTLVWTKPAAGASGSLPRLSSLWNFKCRFLCWS